METAANPAPFRRRTFRFVTVFLLCGMIFWAALAVTEMASWQEEGLFNYKGWLFVRNTFVPYNEVLTDHPPLAYLPIGLTQVLFGPSLLAGRMFGALCWLLASGLMAFTAKRIAGPGAMVVSLILSLTHMYSASYFCTGTPYALSALFVGGVIWFALDRKSHLYFLWMTIFAILAMLTFSINAVFAFACVIFLVFDRSLKEGQNALLAGAPIATVPLTLLFAWGAKPQALLSVYRPGAIYKGLTLADPPFMPFTFDHEAGLAMKFAVTWLPFFALLLMAAILRKSGDDENDVTELDSNHVRLLRFCLITFAVMVAFCAYGAGLRSRENYPEAALAFLPLLQIPAAVYGARAFARQKIATATVLILCLLPPMGPTFFLWVKIRHSETTELQRLAETGRVIASVTEPDDIVFAYGSPHIMLEAGRVGFPELIDRDRTLAFDQNSRLLKQRAFYNPTMAKRWLRMSDAAVIDTWANGKEVDPRADRMIGDLQEILMVEFKEAATIETGDLTRRGGHTVKVRLIE